MKTIIDFINESYNYGDDIFKNEESLSVLSSLILYACNNFNDFMHNLNTIGPVDNKDLTEDKVKKYLQSFDNEISAYEGVENMKLDFKK